MSKIRLHGTSSGYVEIAPAATASNNTLTAPSTVGEIIAKDAAGAIGVTSVHTTNVVATGTTKVGAAVTISESGIEASGIGITCANINGGSIGGRRNIIINGAMVVAQRGTSSTTSGYGCVDRFALVYSGTDEEPTQAQADVASGTTPYTNGFRKAFKITNGNQTGGAGVTDFIWFRYLFEAQDIANSGWNYTSNSSYVTLSFWVKSSVAQTFKGYLRSRDGTEQTYAFETGSLTADTWTKITKTIPGNSNLTFDNDINQGLQLNILGFMGTNYTDSSVTEDAWVAYAGGTRMKDNTSTWYTTNDATLEITGVQLEVGSQATPFEHRSYGEELALCQRYCYVITLQNGDNTGIVGQVTDSSTARGIIYFPVPMRAEPTYTGSATLCRYEAADPSDDFNFSALAIHRTPTQRPVSLTGMNQGLAASSMTAGQAFLVIARANNGKLTYDAEV
jgi:hypothetical protein